MQALLEFAPLVAFFVAYYAAGMYVATAVLMVAMAALLAIDYLHARRIPPMHGLSALLVFAFGTATLLLRDQRFIQWKPTVFFWLVSAAFLASFWIGRQTLVERLFGTIPGMPSSRIARTTWRRLNALWVAFCALLGAANLAVAFNASVEAWVNFKVFGITAAMLLFLMPQMLWLMRQSADRQATPSSSGPARNPGLVDDG